jgi:L-asparaginase/Glu-tRNA(Gln) amidotransferase subunit D
MMSIGNLTAQPIAGEPMLTVYVITTGGTIEKIYQESTGSVENLENKIARYLRLLRLPDLQVEASSLMNKDSLEMTAAEWEELTKCWLMLFRGPRYLHYNGALAMFIFDPGVFRR